MAVSPVPRPPDLAAFLLRLQERIRRLEVNRQNGLPPKCGIAEYTVDLTAGGGIAATDTWIPDLSGLTTINDTIGCTPNSSALDIPAGWRWEGAVQFQIHTPSTPVPGDFLTWSASGIGGWGEYRFDPLRDSSGSGGTQLFGATIIGAAGGAPDGAYLGALKSDLGTLFVPLNVSIGVSGISPFACGFTPVGGPV